MNDFNQNILSMYLVFGFIIILGYIRLARKMDSDTLWSNYGKNMITKKRPCLKGLYIFMIFLSVIAGIYLIYYFASDKTGKSGDTYETLIYVGSTFFLAYSMVWAFKPFHFSKTALFLVAAGAAIILSGIIINEERLNDPRKAVAIAAGSLLVFHTFFFDFLIWNGIIKF